MAYRARVSTEGGGQPHLSANGKGGRNGDTREGRETAECMRAFGPHASKEQSISVERREPRADGLSGVSDGRAAIWGDGDPHAEIAHITSRDCWERLWGKPMDKLHGATWEGGSL